MVLIHPLARPHWLGIVQLFTPIRSIRRNLPIYMSDSVISRHERRECENVELKDHLGHWLGLRGRIRRGAKKLERRLGSDLSDLKSTCD
jgi:hypothetical protein